MYTQSLPQRDRCYVQQETKSPGHGCHRSGGRGLGQGSASRRGRRGGRGGASGGGRGVGKLWKDDDVCFSYKFWTIYGMWFDGLLVVKVFFHFRHVFVSLKCFLSKLFLG